MTFGKKFKFKSNFRLIENQIIRAKLGNMIRQIESTQNWLENITYQMNTLTLEESRNILASPMALLKVQTSQTLDYCAKEAVQIFGGYF
jgi:alkylation response protein AidB-like acyl-CoA dehydrogenase